MGSILVARALPETGGDTMFANMYAAYDALPTALKTDIANLRAVHSNAHVFGNDAFYKQSDAGQKFTNAEMVGEAVHPVVLIHPESGRKALYVNPAFTVRFDGQSKAESKPLLMELYAHAMKKEFACRFQWRRGSVAFWDNRATWHFALNDYHGQERLMHRITVAGSPLN
jgi:taurine dioxygenase